MITPFFEEFYLLKLFAKRYKKSWYFNLHAQVEIQILKVIYVYDETVIRNDMEINARKWDLNI